MTGGAIFDATGAYRYRLWRAWDEGLPRVGFVLLNPSTADAATDDRTIARCVGFAQSWGYGGIEIANLFAFRTPYHRTLRQAPDPVGPDNDQELAAFAGRVSMVVAGWGVAGAFHERAREVLAAPWWPADARCLGWTAGGEPRHPLYVPGARQPLPFPLR